METQAGKEAKPRLRILDDRKLSPRANRFGSTQSFGPIYPELRRWHFRCRTVPEFEEIMAGFARTFADRTPSYAIRYHPARPLRIDGEIYGHPDFSDGDLILTSAIMRITEDTEARNNDGSDEKPSLLLPETHPLAGRVFLATTFNDHLYRFAIDDPDPTMVAHILKYQ